MRLSIAIALLGLCTAFSVAQTQPKPAANAPKPAPASVNTSQSSAGLPTEATVDSFMKYMFGYDPEIEWKVLQIKQAQAPGVSSVLVEVNGPKGTQELRLQVLPGGQWAVVGDLMPFGADPFAATRAKLAEGNGPARGPVDAPVTIVEFSDLECPACKAAQPTIERLLADVPNARFVFQNFPLENLHPWAFRAATYADCIGRENNAAFWKFVHTVYQNQEQVTTENVDQRLTEFAQESGANGTQAAACAAQPATAERVRQSLALGTALNIGGTPTLFVNGREIPSVTGIPYDLLKAVVTGTPK